MSISDPNIALDATDALRCQATTGAPRGVASLGLAQIGTRKTSIYKTYARLRAASWRSTKLRPLEEDLNFRTAPFTTPRPHRHIIPWHRPPNPEPRIIRNCFGSFGIKRHKRYPRHGFCNPPFPMPPRGEHNHRKRARVPFPPSPRSRLSL